MRAFSGERGAERDQLFIDRLGRWLDEGVGHGLAEDLAETFAQPVDRRTRSLDGEPECGRDLLVRAAFLAILRGTEERTQQGEDTVFPDRGLLRGETFHRGLEQGAGTLPFEDPLRRFG